MKFKYFSLLLICFIIACNSSNYTLKNHDKNLIQVNSNKDSLILKMIKPYSDAIEIEMSKQIAYTKKVLTKKGLESLLGNFVTDLCLKIVNEKDSIEKANMCVMNKGGLRTDLAVGGITIGDIYSLMPFENELVIVELNKEELNNLFKHIAIRGEPFSGAKIILDSTNLISASINYSDANEHIKNNQIRILTSDYLANGGDNMKFFIGKKQEKIGLKVRDAIILYCSGVDTLNINLDKRIFIKNE